MLKNVLEMCKEKERRLNGRKKYRELRLQEDFSRKERVSRIDRNREGREARIMRWRSVKSSSVKNFVNKYSGKSVLASEPCCGLLMRWPQGWRVGS